MTYQIIIQQQHKGQLKITAFKDQRTVSNIFYSHWKEWENTVTGIQQTRIYQKLHRILNKEL